ncbi:DNA-binding protein [Veillonella montpellierensis DNF00314]|uniref:UPF0122 protein HMPREF0872_01585 n=1 Tax=Veillonella montpellierensis DNF00314 TaxID=1401067 RepID=A0A096CSN4_9FIRM|nr:YlxM family DNA-binding protein [Veillonella montpellierensis]KGF48309.1 DNA-binding protein [Veillonella montpellierensis DNF00314]
MEERVLVSLLLDFYGMLLTDKQKHCLQLHHEDDMSLGEIAEELGVSRQAVYDNLKKAMQLLTGYEEKLHLIAQYERRKALIAAMKSELSKEIISVSNVQKLLMQMEG